MVNLADGALGPETSYSLKFENKKLVVTVNYQGQDLGGSMSISIDSDHLIDRLSEAIPGTLDDSILKIVKASL